MHPNAHSPRVGDPHGGSNGIRAICHSTTAETARAPLRDPIVFRARHNGVRGDAGLTAAARTYPLEADGVPESLVDDILSASRIGFAEVEIGGFNVRLSR